MNPVDDNRRGATRMNSQDRKFKTVLDGIKDVDVKFKNKIVTAFQEEAQVKMARIADKLALERQLQITQQDFECAYTQMPWQQMEAG